MYDETETYLTMEMYSNWLNSQGLTESTQDFYLQYLRNFFRRGITVDDFKDIKKIKTEFIKIRGVKPTTIKKYKQGVQKFSKFCHEFYDFPLIELHKVKVGSYLPRPLLPQEVLKIYNSIRDNERHHMIFHTLMCTGLRLSEFCNLKIKDCSPDYIMVRNGKGRKDRVVYISKQFSRELWEWIGKRKTGYVFKGIDVPNMSKNALRMVIERIAKKSGVKFSCHRVRHTYATMCVERGINIHTLQSQMGHSHIQTTSTYLLMNSDAHKREIQKLDNCDDGWY